MIKKIGNFILIGTSHVSKKSVVEIKKAIEEYNPKAICIELDEGRLQSLLNKNRKKDRNSIRMLKEVGVSGYFFAMIAGFVQDRVGKSLGIEPGVDMLNAYKLSKKSNIPTYLIDIDIRITLKKLSNLSFSKKVKLFSNLVIKSFKKEYRENLDLQDLKKGEVPDEKVIELAIDIFRKEVPDLYKILIEDRNKYMVRKLIEIYKEELNKIEIKSKLESLDEKEETSKNKDSREEIIIFGVVGAGHLKGMIEILEKEIKKEENQKLEKELVKEVDNKNSINLSFKIGN